MNEWWCGSHRAITLSRKDHTGMEGESVAMLLDSKQEALYVLGTFRKSMRDEKSRNPLCLQTQGTGEKAFK